MEIAMRIQSLNYKIENSMRAVVYTFAPKGMKALTKQRRRWYFGMIHNLKKYRKMFGKQYGELGLLVLPVAIISILTVIIISSYAISKAVRGWYGQIKLYSTINFDFINNINLQGDLLLISVYRILSEGIVIYGAIFFIIAITMLIFINKRIKSIDKPIGVLLNYIFFMFFYSILFSFWWILSGMYSIFRKDISWR